MATHGMFVWTDLQTSDVEEAKRFYGEVFGWDARDASSEDMPYWELIKDDQVVAGLGPLDGAQQDEGVPPNWTSYVAVDDAAEVCSKVGDGGGSVLMDPMEVGEEGTVAIVQDPTGGVLGLWQPGTHEGADVFNEPGSMCWNELATRDVDAAKGFYAELLPWDLDDADFGGFSYTLIELDDRPNGGLFTMGESFPDDAPPHWIVYFAVDDTDGTLDKVRDAGGEVRGEPIDTPFGRVANVADPQGASFRVIQLEQDPTRPT